MFPDLSPRTKAATFAVLALLSCAALSFAMRSTGETAATAAMFTPASSVLIMMLVVTRDGWHRAGWAALGVHRAGFRYWPFALLAPAAVLVASNAVVALTGLAHADFSTWPSPPLLVVRYVLLVASVGCFAFFEEIGWRGYLLPIVHRDGRPFAAARVGFLQGLWHLPIVFIVPGAYLTDGNRWLTVPVFLGVLTAAGVVYGWARDRSGSVWPAVILHAAFNVGLGLAVDTMITRDLATVSLIGTETGVATLGAVVLLALWVATRSRVEPAPTRPGPIAVPAL